MNQQDDQRSKSGCRDVRLFGLHGLKGHGLCDSLLTGEDASLMARKEGIRRDNWGCEGGCDCEEDEEGFLEGFHLDCFPL